MDLGAMGIRILPFLFRINGSRDDVEEKVALPFALDGACTRLWTLGAGLGPSHTRRTKRDKAPIGLRIGEKGRATASGAYTSPLFRTDFSSQT